MRRLKELGIGVTFEKENIDTLDAKGEVLLTILSSLAQDESRSISENSTWGIRKRFEQGHFHVNTTKFMGYDKDENGNLEDNDIDLFKLGFVGNGEPMLDYEKLKQYIAHIGDYLKSGRIAAYTITNGLLVDREKLEFFKEYNVNVGFSVDGISAIHDKYRCGTHERVMENIALYKEVNGKYPSMNCTVTL